MRSAAIVCSVLVGGMSCDFAPLPRLNLVSLVASPSVFVLHEKDTRDPTFTLTNESSETISVSSFVVSRLNGGTLTIPPEPCAAQLAAGQSCTTTGHLVATASGQELFQVTMGEVSASLSMTVMPACPQTCGPLGTMNCCDSTVVEGNAEGAKKAGEMFYRHHDNAADGYHSSKEFTATVSDFRLDTYLVTVGRFRAFVNAGIGTRGTPPAQGAGAHAMIPGSGWDTKWSNLLEGNTEALRMNLKCDPLHPNQITWTDAAGPGDSLPINCVTWYEAMAFCIWDGGYLPSEAEWNYAASGGSEHRPYPWSASDSSTTINCSYANYNPSGTYCVNGMNGATNRVGSESPKGDGRWGQADLAGNLFVWSLDFHNPDNPPYPPSCDDCANLTPATDNNNNRVIQGGCFFTDEKTLRAAFYNFNGPRNRLFDLGVRCARTP